MFSPHLPLTRRGGGEEPPEGAGGELYESLKTLGFQAGSVKPKRFHDAGKWGKLMEKQNILERVITIPEARKRWFLARVTLRNAIDKELINAVQIGRIWIIDLQSLIDHYGPEPIKFEKKPSGRPRLYK